MENIEHAMQLTGSAPLERGFQIMKKMKLETIEVVTAYVCDRCGRVASVDDPEAEEFTSIDFTGGYQSIFGDGARVSSDICQHCLKETLGEWLRIIQTAFEGK